MPRSQNTPDLPEHLKLKKSSVPGTGGASGGAKDFLRADGSQGILSGRGIINLGGKLKPDSGLIPYSFHKIPIDSR